jgi:hypothetical protein
MSTAASKISPITQNTTLTVVSTGFGIGFPQSGQARASVITSRLQSGHGLIIAANFGAPQRNDKLMF